jgi:para-aminobenzoate synthetase component I
MEQAIRQMNDYGRQRKPFYFIIDFDKKKPIVLSPEDLEKVVIVLLFKRMR